MTKYQPSWELNTIPDDKWASEHGRRQRAKGPRVTYAKLQPCPKCGEMLTATQRRLPACPKCGTKQKRS